MELRGQWACSTEEVRHLAKPKEGFSQYVKPLVDMYDANKDDMPMKSFDAQGLLDELDAYDKLTESIASAQQQLDVLVKTRAMHASNAWRGTLKLYKWGVLAGQSNVTVLRAISRFVQFMKRPRHKSAATTPVTTTASAPTSTATPPVTAM